MSSTPQILSLKKHFRRALGLPEMLISLAISAALLTAVGVALEASFQAYQVNQEQSELMQRSRVIMHRLLGEIRNFDVHRPADADNAFFQQGLTVPSSEIYVGTLNSDTNRYEGFHYRQQDDTLLRTAVTWTFMQNGAVNVVTQSDPRTIVTGLGTTDDTRLQFTIEPMRSSNAARANSTYDLAKRISVRLTIADSALASGLADTTGYQTLTTSAAVVPRRNIWSGPRANIR